MAKVYSLDGAKNTGVVYPVVGLLQHDSNGMADVPDDLVEELLLVRKDHLVREEDYKQLIIEKNRNAHKKTLPDNVKGTADKLDLEEEEEDNENSGNSANAQPVTEDEFRKNISGETKISLQGMCEDFEYPKTEWKDLKKDDLINYLVKKTAEKGAE